MFDSAALIEAITDHFLPHFVCFFMYLDPSTMGCCKNGLRYHDFPSLNFYVKYFLLILV